MHRRINRKCICNFQRCVVVNNILVLLFYRAIKFSWGLLWICLELMRLVEYRLFNSFAIESHKSKIQERNKVWKETGRKKEKATCAQLFLSNSQEVLSTGKTGQ